MTETPTTNEDEYGTLLESDVRHLTDIFGPDWRSCVTPEGADRLLSLITEQQSKKPDPIEDGDDCPVCGEPIINTNPVIAEMVGESISAEKICIEEKDDDTGEVHSIIHLDDDRVPSPHENEDTEQDTL